jgi:hypothetical protein
MSYNIQPINYKQQKNGPYQGHQTRNVGPQLYILQLNIEGLSCNEAEYLSRLLLDNKINVLLLQETYAEKEEDLLNKGSIAGLRLSVVNIIYISYIRRSLIEEKYLKIAGKLNSSIIV